MRTGEVCIFLLPLLVTLFPRLRAQEEEEEYCFLPTAALNYHGNVLLIGNGRFFELDEHLMERRHGMLADEFRTTEDIDAVTIQNEDSGTYFFSDNRFFQYAFDYWLTKQTKDISLWGPFFKEGIDAAGRLGDLNYYFKGCSYAIIRKRQEGLKEGTLEDLGLPCDVDAAWNHNDKLYVTKAARYWMLDESGVVEEPGMLADLVTLTSEELCADKEEEWLYDTLIADQRSYERDHGCVLLDAGVTWDDNKVYLFNDDEYIRLDDAGDQDAKEPVWKWGGLRSDVDAGVKWSGNGITYLFKGNQYYRYQYPFIDGPEGNELWAPFFLKGIDAAGNWNGQSYFFKGCQMALYGGPESKVQAVYKNRDLNLPCHPHAAFTRGSTLYVIKMNKVWEFEAGEDKAFGPNELSTVARPESWNVCPPPTF